MTSRSSTLRPSADPFGTDTEKEGNQINGQQDARRSSFKDTFQRRSDHENDDPFGDEGDEDGVKYRTLKWW